MTSSAGDTTVEALLHGSEDTSHDMGLGGPLAFGILGPELHRCWLAATADLGSTHLCFSIYGPFAPEVRHLLML